MFINLKTGRRAFLIEHDDDVIHSAKPAGDEGPRHITAGFEFFGSHREATREEIEAYFGKPEDPPAAIQPARSTGAATDDRKDSDEDSKPLSAVALASPDVLQGEGGAGVVAQLQPAKPAAEPIEPPAKSDKK